MMLRREIYFRVALVGILVLGFALRITGVNWDSYQHLNPDERFLTMVLGGMKWPGVFDYFKTSVSTFNPVNVGFGFFVYGTLPLFITKAAAGVLGMGDYNGYLIVGRVLSALFDWGTIWVVYALGKNLFSGSREKLAGLAAAFFYAGSVVPIQNSHFFIVDTFGNFFGALTLLFLVRTVNGRGLVNWMGLGASAGAAISCKLNMVLVAGGAVGVATVLGVWQNRERSWKRLLAGLLITAVTVYAMVRVFLPYAFEDYSLGNLEKKFVANSKTAGMMMRGEVDMPPAILWAGTNFFFPIQEMAVWGLGLPLGVLTMFALGWNGAKIIRERDWLWGGVAGVVIAQIVYQTGFSPKPQRYYLLAYVLAALIAGRFVTAGKSEWKRYVFFGVGFLTLLWAVAFTAIYRVPHSRVVASRWIYQNVPRGARVGWELWDDPLPLLIDGHGGGEYEGVEMALYDTENEVKREELIADLTEADYIALSSNRLYGSIPRIPGRYPLAIRYYQLLFSEKLGFLKVAEFNSYPRLGRVRIVDQGAEEIFTVYDHPRVVIFAKNSDFSETALRDAFGDIDFSGVKQILAKDVTVPGWGKSF